MAYDRGLFDLPSLLLDHRPLARRERCHALRHCGLSRDRTAAVSDGELRGRRVTDARGAVVAPGFIDPISHGQDLENDRLQILDGVTTKLQLESGVADQATWHQLQKGKR